MDLGEIEFEPEDDPDDTDWDARETQEKYLKELFYRVEEFEGFKWKGF